jgi:hypothetical protein
MALMTQVRDVQRHKWLMAVSFGLLGILWVIGGLFFFVRLSSNNAWFGIMQGLYVLGFILFNAIFILVMRRKFRCPECGGVVEDVGNGMEGDSILKLCKHCDTIWRIGTV